MEGHHSSTPSIIHSIGSRYRLLDSGRKLFKRHSMKIERTDVEIINKQKLKLQCSHYQPYNRPCKDLPYVMYLHGNASCRL